MKLCPNKNIKLLITLSKEEVIEKLSQNIEYVEKLRITGIRHNSFRNYEGYIIKNEIKFRRILKSGANSFIPQISGQITEMDNKTYFQLNARLHKVIEGFMIGFNCFLILLLIIGLINMDLTSDIGFHIQFLTELLVMIVIANGMPRLFFNYELYRLEKDFRKILTCNDIKPSNDSRLNRFIENKIMIF